MSDTGLFAAAEIGHEITKDEYEARLEELRVELLNLQFDLRLADFSVIVLLVGDDRPGYGRVARLLHEWMDVRFIDTHVMFGEERQEERERPEVWRYWNRLPPDGRIGLFLGAWPALIMERALAEDWDDFRLDAALDHAERFERELALDRSLVLKFWLHLPKDEHKKRLAAAKKHPERHWQIGEHDWHVFDVYDRGMVMAERLVRRTNTSSAPWTIVDSTDERYRSLAVGQRLADALRARLEAQPTAPQPALPGAPPPSGGQGVLNTIDLNATADPDSYSGELAKLQARLNELSREAADAGVPCVMVFEGSDAAGKGGTIRRVTHAMPIDQVRVVPIAAPTDEEAARHYLWRFWRHIPRVGQTVIFDRSWYGRVLVERVEEFAQPDEWLRAYEEINEFEAVLEDHGMPVIKFWLQIDADEQLRRFESRADAAYKKYKLTDEDYRNREKWDAYAQAVDDMVARTSTSYAPWYLVPSNDKKYARLMVLRTVCERLDERLAQVRKESKSKKNKKKKKSKGKV
jgi:polyphosphate:AMP phosphotransferase